MPLTFVNAGFCAACYSTAIPIRPYSNDLQLQLLIGSG
ncbi:Uncharacterised protein [Vibrio cholerae]|nr:Uncharacterised protein [Vibrio cholerae]CSI41159.1 Uncharacterised protein [Vibrio cholerae]